jgi:EAL domain-containing protein (putative c-di-GMP-specific phosphodiesterase class I)
VLKIDKSFIDHITASAKQTALVQAIIRLAGALDLQVIAEGIEEVAQRDLLDHMGCQFGQGYTFARPLTASAARRLLHGPHPAASQPASGLPHVFHGGPHPALAETSGKEAHG